MTRIHVIAIIGTRDLSLIEAGPVSDEYVTGPGGRRQVDHRERALRLAKVTDGELAGAVGLPILDGPLSRLLQESPVDLTLIATRQPDGQDAWKLASDTAGDAEAIRRLLLQRREVVDGRLCIEEPIIVSHPAALRTALAEIAEPVIEHVVHIAARRLYYLEGPGTATLRLALRIVLAQIAGGSTKVRVRPLLERGPQVKDIDVAEAPLGRLLADASVAAVAPVIERAGRPHAMQALLAGAGFGTGRQQLRDLAGLAAGLADRHPSPAALADVIARLSAEPLPEPSCRVVASAAAALAAWCEDRQLDLWRQLLRDGLFGLALAGRENAQMEDFVSLLTTAVDDALKHGVNQGQTVSAQLEPYRRLRNTSFLAHEPLPLRVEDIKPADLQVARELDIPLGLQGNLSHGDAAEMVRGAVAPLVKQNDPVGVLLAEVRQRLTRQPRQGRAGDGRTWAVVPVGPALVDGGNDPARGVRQWCEGHASPRRDELGFALADLIEWPLLAAELPPVEQLLLLGTHQVPNDQRDTYELARVLAASIPNWEPSPEVQQCQAVCVDGNPADEATMLKHTRTALATHLKPLASSDTLVLLWAGGAPGFRIGTTLACVELASERGAHLRVVSRSVDGDEDEIPLAELIADARRRVATRRVVEELVQSRDGRTLSEFLSKLDEPSKRSFGLDNQRINDLKGKAIQAQGVSRLRGDLCLQARLSALWHEARSGLLGEEQARGLVLLCVLFDGILKLGLIRAGHQNPRTLLDGECRTRDSALNRWRIGDGCWECANRGNLRSVRFGAGNTPVSASVAAELRGCATDPSAGCVLGAVWADGVRKVLAGLSPRVWELRQALRPTRNAVLHDMLRRGPAVQSAKARLSKTLRCESNTGWGDLVIRLEAELRADGFEPGADGAGQALAEIAVVFGLPSTSKVER